MSLSMKIVILFVFLCLQNKQVLGQVYCPDPIDILPCICSENGIDDVRIHCSAAQSEEQIETAFLADFPLTNMTRFSINNNRILTELTKNLFLGISFQQIHIDATSISSISASFFDTSYHTLTVINIIGNEIHEFPLEDLSRFTAIESVYLTDNKLTSMPPLSSTTLRNIFLSANSIETIPNFAFRECQAVTFVDFTDNLISDLSSSAFTGATSLEFIDLYLNEIDILRTGTFSALHDLRRISLNYNPIMMIEDGAFVDLPSLNRLDISYNEIVSFGRDIFFEVHNITSLNMHDTNLEEVEPYTFIDYMESDIDIKLPRNNISTIVANSFVGISQGIIDLGSNNITDVESGSFPTFSDSILSLSSNLISNLDENWLGSLLEASNSVDVSHNPLDCECDMLWLFLNPQYFNQLLQDPTCENGTKISDLDPGFYFNNC